MKGIKSNCFQKFVFILRKNIQGQWSLENGLPLTSSELCPVHQEIRGRVVSIEPTPPPLMVSQGQPRVRYGDTAAID